MAAGVYSRQDFRNALVGNGWFFFHRGPRYWLLRVGPFWLDRLLPEPFVSTHPTEEQ